MKLAGVSGYQSGFVFDMINNAALTLKIKSYVNNFVKYRKYMYCVFWNITVLDKFCLTFLKMSPHFFCRHSLSVFLRMDLFQSSHVIRVNLNNFFLPFCHAGLGVWGRNQAQRAESSKGEVYFNVAPIYNAQNTGRENTDQPKTQGTQSGARTHPTQHNT